MGIYSIKPRFRQALTRTAQGLASRGITPDQITTGGLVFAGLGGAAILTGPVAAGAYAAVPVMALGRIACNALDGLVAELQHSGRPAGELYNETADRLGDLLFLGPLVAVPDVSVLLVLAAVAFSQLASFIGITSKAAGSARRYDGPMGKPDRMLVLSVAALVALVVPAGTAFDVAAGIIAVGGVATGWNRYRRSHGDLEATGAGDARAR